MPDESKESQTATLPPVPLTMEGSWVLHQMFRFDRSRWNLLESMRRETYLRDFARQLEQDENREQFPSAAFLLVGKGDLLLVHFRESLEALQQVQNLYSRLEIFSYLQPVGDYSSVVELGLYESSVKTYRALTEKGVAPHTEEWNQVISETVQRQREAMASRLYPSIPDRKYICFYPMDRLRGEQKNWYQVSLEERARMMHEHGMIGRRYADSVKQIITGSIGYDDWEWGVDLFADDPGVFKTLIYEMRFDEVSAIYAKFGKFFIGVRCKADHLETAING